MHEPCCGLRELVDVVSLVSTEYTVLKLCIIVSKCQISKFHSGPTLNTSSSLNNMSSIYSVLLTGTNSLRKNSKFLASSLVNIHRKYEWKAFTFSVRNGSGAASHIPQPPPKWFLVHVQVFSNLLQIQTMVVPGQVSYSIAESPLTSKYHCPYQVCSITLQACLFR